MANNSVNNISPIVKRSKVDKINAGLDDGQIEYIVPPPINTTDEFGVEMVENVVDVPKNDVESKFGKNDIRSFGQIGLKTEVKSKKSEIMSRVEMLKKSSHNLLPILADRVDAGYLLDKLEGNVAMNVGKSSTGQNVKKKSGNENVCFIGHEVKSLFPSLKSV